MVGWLLLVVDALPWHPLLQLQRGKGLPLRNRQQQKVRQRLALDVCVCVCVRLMRLDAVALSPCHRYRNSIDVDKFDYIARDSKHVGMQSGFDHERYSDVPASTLMPGCRPRWRHAPFCCGAHTAYLLPQSPRGSTQPHQPVASHQRRDLLLREGRFPGLRALPHALLSLQAGTRSFSALSPRSSPIRAASPSSECSIHLAAIHCTDTSGFLSLSLSSLSTLSHSFRSTHTACPRGSNTWSVRGATHTVTICPLLLLLTPVLPHSGRGLTVLQ